VYPGGQLQMGLCDVTRQMAPAPQEPGHGSLHFCWMQALSAGQSLLMMHSAEEKICALVGSWQMFTMSMCKLFFFFFSVKKLFSLFFVNKLFCVVSSNN
jgi:hypothetical protein